ncbi:MAG: hypothetical protein WA814_03230, partial [Candidatus Baltobacteraceae bacterium]
MISEEREEGGRGNFLWAILLSIALHATLLPLAFLLVAPTLQIAQRQPQRELVVSSTVVRIEKRPVPQPRITVPRPRPPLRPTQP